MFDRLAEQQRLRTVTSGTAGSQLPSPDPAAGATERNPMRLTERLDPRRHLAAAIGWSVFVIVALASLAAANLAARAAEKSASDDTQRLLTQFATQIRHALDMSLQTRLSIVEATAAQIVASSDRGTDAVQRHLEAVQAQFPEFAWLGVTDMRGVVVSATHGLLQGESVAQRPWFMQAQVGPFLGDVHKAVLLEKKLPIAADGRPLRWVDLAAPISHGPGKLVGVISGLLSWHWIEKLQAELVTTLDTRRQLDLLIADSAGLVLVGPATWTGQSLTASIDPTEGGRYVVGRHAERGAGDVGLRWTVIVRQPSSSALAPAHAVRTTVFLVVLTAGLAAALAVVLLTRVLTRRLGMLAQDAQAVRQGQRLSIAVPAGADEVSRIGGVMAELIDHLQREKASLATLNAELDAKVVERTARIERLADGARHAAVTRERLRLARDLHDTLAHSLMALLTQIRLIRKMRDRLPAAQVDAEMARAEDVAASGLADARAAITQMRHNGVREAGLATALRDLLTRFSERTGVQASLQASGATADMADERAEVVFRIVEEALHNVERHARATTATVSIGAAAQGQSGEAPGVRMVVSVEDDGVGFDTTTPSPGHYGLIGIREQAALIGARLDVRSAPGRGTLIRLEFAA